MLLTENKLRQIIKEEYKEMMKEVGKLGGGRAQTGAYFAGIHDRPQQPQSDLQSAVQRLIAADYNQEQERAQQLADLITNKDKAITVASELRSYRILLKLVHDKASKEFKLYLK